MKLHLFNLDSLLMKNFQVKPTNYSGVLHYLYFDSQYSKQYPILEANGHIISQYQFDEISCLVSNAGLAKVFYEAPNSKYSNIIIDLGHFRMIPLHMEIGTVKSGSPPVKFQLFGSNDKENWKELTDQINKTDLCPYITEKCQENVSTKIEIPYKKGIFRYFEYRIYQNRYQLEYNEYPTPDLRLSGFDLYGFLFSEKSDLIKAIHIKQLFYILCYSWINPK